MLQAQSGKADGMIVCTNVINCAPDLRELLGWCHVQKEVYRVPRKLEKYYARLTFSKILKILRQDFRNSELKYYKIYKKTFVDRSHMRA